MSRYARVLLFLGAISVSHAAISQCPVAVPAANAEEVSRRAARTSAKPREATRFRLMKTPSIGISMDQRSPLTEQQM